MEYQAKHKLVIMLSVLSGMFLSSLDQTIVATALPKIVASLGGIELFSWVISSYLLASTATIIIYGKLSDIYGRKKLFIFGIGIFLVGSVLSALSQNIIQLIIYRAIQGIGGGAIMSNAVAIIGDLFPPAERGKWQGFIGGTFSLASIIGPILGGFIADNFGWHWIFLLNLPIGIFSIVLLLKFLPSIAASKNIQIDYKGSILLVAAITSLMFALLQLSFSSNYIWQSIILLVFSGIFLILLYHVEKKTREPVLSFDILRNKVFILCAMAIFVSTLVMFGVSIYLPLFVQTVLGMTATNSGAIMTPLVIGSFISSTLAGQIISKTGKYKAMAIGGFAIATLGVVLLSFMGAKTGNLQLVINLTMLGLGLGVTFPIFMVAAQNVFEHSKLGVVTASIQLFRNLGGMFGTAIFSLILLASLNGNGIIETLPLSLRNPEALLQSGVLSNYSAAEIMGLKTAMSSAISHVFIVVAFFAFVMMIALFFLKEHPLRKTHKQTLEEAGIELAKEDGVPFKEFK
jgi:EmrB/QacA subfamily drug resistance transporter